jgi:hypothetical protein
MRSRATRSQAGWRIAFLSDDAALFLLEVARPDGSSAWWRAHFSRSGDGWALVDTGTCELRPFFGEGLGPGAWELAPGAGPTPETTTLTVLVTELACASGQSAEGRVTEPALAYDGASVTIYFAVETLPGNHTCQGNPPLAAEVELAEPLGERVLLDGSTYPPVQRWP